MGEDNIEEFDLARRGEAELVPFLVRHAAEFSTVTPDGVASAFGDLVSEVDRATLSGEFASCMAASLRRSVSAGTAGWRDDDLAFTRPWGFQLDAIDRPVAVGQGEQDRMVPFDHGRWLAAHIPGARQHLYRDEGHLSLTVTKFPQILDDLLDMAAAGA